MTEPKSSLCIVKTVTSDQISILKKILEEKGWDFSEAPYCHFKAKKEKTSIAAYESGKLVIQGKDAEDFVHFTLEPEVLGEFSLPSAPVAPVPSEAHAGIDESGKGDFFGPLVIACAFVDSPETADELERIGVKDSKRIKNDKLITEIARKIRAIIQGRFGVVAVMPETYNRIYDSFGSLNRLLAWGHARALENLLEKAPECTRALADKFGDESLIRNALFKAGRSVVLEQRTKAESDIAVAAASILARAEFVRRLTLLEESTGCRLPKGAGTQVDEIASKLAVTGGAELLSKVAKMHFRTSYRALGIEEPPKTEWRGKT